MTSRWLHTIALVAVSAGVVCPAPAVAMPSRPPAFYVPPSPLPAGRHGDEIRAQRIASPVGKSARLTRVLYRSVDAMGRPVAVSGTLLVPRGRPPRGGWPIVSWAHGTTGIADICAPSLDASSPGSPIQRLIDGWVKRGYAVAKTDYAGLGTPSPHSYLMGVAEGRNVIDIVRAARQVDPTVGRRWIAAGHSQGGQAALFAGAAAARWAPELRLRGVLAYAPASHIGQLARAAGAFTSPSPLSGYAALILQGAASGSRTIDLSAIESERALSLAPLVQERCLPDLEKPDAFGALAPAEMFRPGADLQRLYRLLDAQNPALRIRVPIRLDQGVSDTTVPKLLTDELAAELRGRQDRLRYTTYPNVNHVQIVAAAAAPTLRWLRIRLSRRGPG